MGRGEGQGAIITKNGTHFGVGRRLIYLNLVVAPWRHVLPHVRMPVLPVCWSKPPPCCGRLWASAPVLLLARMLVEAFSANQQQEGSLPGSLIPHKARQVLENENAPEALCRMGSRLTHFGDEFQDTSREQWYALRPLLEEALSRGGSLTWVVT